MTSSMTDAGNPQQGGKKDKDKNKDLAVLVDDKLAEVNNSIVTLMGRVDEIETRIKELESEGDLEELRGKMQIAVNSVVANVNGEIQALRTSKAAQEEELRACRAEVESYKAKVEALEAQLKVCMAVVANMSNGGSRQASTTPKGMRSNLLSIVGQGTHGRSTIFSGNSKPTLER